MKKYLTHMIISITIITTAYSAHNNETNRDYNEDYQFNTRPCHHGKRLCRHHQHRNNNKHALTGLLLGGGAGAGIGAIAAGGKGALIGGPVGAVGGVLLSEILS